MMVDSRRRMAKSKKRSETPSSDPSVRAPEGANGPSPSNGNARDRIATRAYELYLARGANHGGDFDDWITAERELTGAHPGSDRRE
jgi:hypothetical protein